jgi:hypothetical protein
MKIRSILAGTLTVTMILTGSLAANATDPHGNGGSNGGGQNPPQDPGLSVGQGQSQGQGQTTTNYNKPQGGSGYGGSAAGGTGNGGQVQVGDTSLTTGPSTSGASVDIGDTNLYNGASSQSGIKDSGNSTSQIKDSGNSTGTGYGGSTGPVTNTSSSGGNQLSGGNFSFTDNSKSTYKGSVYYPGVSLPGSSNTVLPTTQCFPNGTIAQVNTSIGAKSDGFNIGAGHLFNFGYSSNRPSRNEAYYTSVASQAQTRAELLSDATTMHNPVGQMLFGQNVHVATAMNGKALKVDSKKAILLQQQAKAAVEANVSMAKKGMDTRFGCGRVGDQQVIVAPSPGPAPGPAPVEPVQPVEPGPAPIEVPAVPSNPESIPASH